MSRALTESDVTAFRERLCAIAAKLFIEAGEHGFNMRELARQMNVSAMTPYRYFRDKNEILASVRAMAFARLAERLESALDAPGSAREKMNAVSAAYVAFALKERPYYRLMFDLSQPADGSTPELAGQERRVRVAMTEYVRLMADADTDPDLMGQVLWSTLHGVTALHLAGKLGDDDYGRILRESLKVIANADDEVPIGAPLAVRHREQHGNSLDN